MSNKQIGMVTLAVLLLAEAFLDRAVSRTASALGVSGGVVALGGLVAGGIVAALD